MLLNLIGGLDHPTSGTLEVDGLRVDELSEGYRRCWRANHLLHFPDVQPAAGAHRRAQRRIAIAADQSRSREPHETRRGGAEARRPRASRQAPAARAFRRPGAARRHRARDRHRSDAVAVRERTGDLDRKSGDEILTLLEALNDEYGKTIIMVTHDPHAAERAHRVIHLDKGMLSEGPG